MVNYGKYRAIVKETLDPDYRGRIKVECPEILGSQISNWALPCFQPNQFSVPKLGELVWIEFEGGRIDNPIWTGVFYTRAQWAEKFKETYDPKKIILSPYNSTDTVIVNGYIRANNYYTKGIV